MTDRTKRIFLCLLAGAGGGLIGELGAMVARIGAHAEHAGTWLPPVAAGFAMLLAWIVSGRVMALHRALDGVEEALRKKR
jgi:hypothetical protein